MRKIYFYSFFMLLIAMSSFSFSIFSMTYEHVDYKLIRALREKDHELFKEALYEGANVNSVENPLYIAILTHAPRTMLCSLLLHRANAMYVAHPIGNYLSTLMHLAVEVGNWVAVDLLYYFYPHLIDHEDFRGWTPEIYAEKINNAYIIYLFKLYRALAREEEMPRLEFVALVQEARKKGFLDSSYEELMVFHLAVHSRNHAAIEAFLQEIPAAMRALDPNGKNAYELAHDLKLHGLLKLFPEQRENFNIFIEHIKIHDLEAINNLIINLGAKLKYARSQEGFDPLEVAIASGAHEDVLRVLYNSGLYREDEETSIYHFAVRFNNLKALKLLKIIDSKFAQNILFEESGGYTPHILAQDLGHTKIAAWFNKIQSGSASDERRSLKDSILSFISDFTN